MPIDQIVPTLGRFLASRDALAEDERHACGRALRLQLTPMYIRRGAYAHAFLAWRVADELQRYTPLPWSAYPAWRAAKEAHA